MHIKPSGTLELQLKLENDYFGSQIFRFIK